MCPRWRHLQPQHPSDAAWLDGITAAVHAFSLSSGVARGITYGIAVLAVVSGAYSIYNRAVRRRTRSGAGMELRLLRVVRQRIHAVMEAGLTARSLVIGVVVSVLESICTGQVFLPTIAYVVRDPGLRLHTMSSLVLYCVMFVVPLIIIFVLAYFGLQSSALARLAQRHTGTTKLLLAAVFIGLAALLSAIAN